MFQISLNLLGINVKESNRTKQNTNNNNKKIIKLLEIFFKYILAYNNKKQ